MKIGIVYMARNVIDGRAYVGHTTDSLATRKAHHYSMAHLGRIHFHRVLAATPREQFEWVVLESNIPQDRLLEREKHWTIKTCSTDPNKGYNVVVGNCSGRVIDQQTRERYRDVSTRKKAVKCLETDEKFASLELAAKTLGLRGARVSRAINDGHLLHGLTFVYI